MFSTYDQWKTRSPDDERQSCPDCGGEVWRNGYGTLCCERCDEEDAAQEQYEYEMQARIESHDNEAAS